VVLVTDAQAFEGEQPADAASSSKRLRLRRSERPSWRGGRLRPVRCGGNRGTHGDLQGPWTLRRLEAGVRAGPAAEEDGGVGPRVVRHDASEVRVDDSVHRPVERLAGLHPAVEEPPPGRLLLGLAIRRLSAPGKGNPSRWSSDDPLQPGGSPESRGCGSGDALLDSRARAAIRSRHPRSSRLAILPGFPAYHLGVPLTRPQGTDPPESEPDHEGREPSSFLTP
jgi:hypothetical protein